MDKKRPAPYDEQDDRELFDDIYTVASATECTGLIPAAPINEDAVDDEQAAADAQALLEAVASGSRVELLRWSVSSEGMDTRRAAAMINAARGRLADILRGKSTPKLSPGQCAALDELLQKCSAMLRLNTGVKHVFGLIAVSGYMQK